MSEPAERTLRERIAVLLAYTGARVPTGNLGGVDINNERVLYTLADEVVRLMEWTRDQCRECVGGAAEDTDERITKLKLTLPPPEWEP